MDIAPNDKLLNTARSWVAQTFFGQMLKQMRDSPFKSDLFEGGRGGQVFAAQLDQRLAERMARTGAGDRLAQSIVKSIRRRSETHVATDHRA